MKFDAVPALLKQGEATGKAASARAYAAQLRQQADQLDAYAQGLDNEIQTLKRAAEIALAQTPSTQRGARWGHRVVNVFKGAAAGWRKR